MKLFFKPLFLLPILFGAPSLSFYLLQKGISLNSSSLIPFSLLGGGQSTTSSPISLRLKNRFKKDLVKESSYSTPINLNNLGNLESQQNENLEIIFFEDSDLSLSKEIDINSNTTIGNLFGELLKNSQTKEIQSQSSKSLKEVQESLGKHNSSFEEIQKSIEAWNKKREESFQTRKTSDKQKAKRQIKKEEEIIPPSIDLEKRKALFCFYKKFEELSGKKEGYSKKLKSVEEGNNLEVKIQDLSANSEVLESLREIGWDSGGMNDFGHYLRGEKKGKNNKDPLTSLLDSQYLQEIRNKAITWKSKTDQFIKGRQMESRSGWWQRNNERHLASSLKIFEGEVKSIESEALSLIASKLLEKMLKKVEK